MATKIKYDACTPRPKYGKDDGVWWHRVGNAVMNDKGQIMIYLDSVPVPSPDKENKIVIVLFEHKDDEERDATRKRKPAAPADDDEIPF